MCALVNFLCEIILDCLRVLVPSTVEAV